MHKYVKHGDTHIWLESTMEISQLTIRTIRIQRVSHLVCTYVKSWIKQLHSTINLKIGKYNKNKNACVWPCNLCIELCLMFGF